MRTAYILGAALASVAIASAAHCQTRIAIVDAEVFDGSGAPPYIATVVISGGLIESVERGGKAPRGAKVVRAKGLALLPGLYDLHTHHEVGAYPSYAPQIGHEYVSAGVTTVVDMATTPEEYEPRRAWYAELPFPNVIFAGRVSTLGGHGALAGDQSRTKWVNTPFAATQAVGELATYSPDALKAFTDGWRYGSGIDETSMDEPTLTAAVKEAHARSLPVLSHTVTLDRGKSAARAGVDVIAHSMADQAVDQSFIDLMLKSGTAYAPTLAVYEPARPGQPAFAPNNPAFQQRVVRFQRSLANVKTLHAAGVLIALASDAGNTSTPHGRSTLRELELLVEAGLTPAEALVVGTSNSARAMGHEDRGVIAPGRRADLVLVKGKPWETISDIRNTSSTYVGGKLMFGNGAPTPVVATMPAPVVPALVIADFESADGRTVAGALALNDLDSGFERSTQQMTIVSTPDRGRFLAVSARMARREDPHTAAVLPFSRGSVTPADVRKYQGVRFSFRGEGDYSFAIVGQSGLWRKPFTASAGWTSYSIPFVDLTKPSEDAVWTGVDLLAASFIIERAPGEAAWMEIDDVSFY
jgi:imidazolonepropionase-like amidohydrolase